MTNIRAVSKAAGVSIATVSRAISSPEKVSEKTAKKVFAAIEEVGYKPNMMARNFRAARTYSFIVLVPDIANAFFANAISAIEQTAHKRGYSVLLGVTNDLPEREQKYIQLVETRQADGIIQLRPHFADDPVPPEDLHIVNACGCENTPYTSVRIDNVGAATVVVEHLIEQGHKRIGLVTGKSANPHSIDRLEGSHSAAKAAGLTIEETLIYDGDFSMNSGKTAAHYFAKLPVAERPTAVFCFNDEMAIGLMRGFTDTDVSVPKDIAVVGFDDIDIAEFHSPSLTTISQPAAALGEVATNTLIDKIEGKEPEQQEQIVPFEFIARESTRRI